MTRTMTRGEKSIAWMKMIRRPMVCLIWCKIKTDAIFILTGGDVLHNIKIWFPYFLQFGTGWTKLNATQSLFILKQEFEPPWTKVIQSFPAHHLKNIQTNLYKCRNPVEMNHWFFCERCRKDYRILPYIIELDEEIQEMKCKIFLYQFLWITLFISLLYSVKVNPSF